MVNIIVAKSDAGVPSADIMDATTFGQVMAMLKHTREREVTLHAGPVAKQPYLPQLVERLLEGGWRVTVYVGSRPVNRLAGMNVSILYDAQSILGVCDREAEVHTPIPVELKESGVCERSGLFLALPSTDLNLDRVLLVVDSIPNMEFVIIGVGWNSWTTGPELIPQGRYAVWAVKLIEVVSALTKRGVITYFACSVPLCLFSRHQLGCLVALKVKWPIAWCSPQYYIEPNGEVKFCPRLDYPHPVNVSEKVPFGEIQKLFGQWLPIRAFCGQAEELRCHSLATQACGGGCLSHSLANWQGPAL